MKRIRRNTIITTSAMLSLAFALSGCAQDDAVQSQETADVSAPSASSSSTPALMEMKEGDVALSEAVKGVNEATFLTVDIKDSASSNSGVVIERDGKTKILHMSVKDESGKVVDEFIQTPDKSYTVISDAYADQYPGVEVGSWVYTEDQGKEEFFSSLFTPKQEDLDKFKGVKGEQVDLNGKTAYKYHNDAEKMTFWVDAQSGQLLMISEDNGMQMTFSDINADKSIQVPSSARSLEEVMKISASAASSSAPIESSNPSGTPSAPADIAAPDAPVAPSESASASAQG